MHHSRLVALSSFCAMLGLFGGPALAQQAAYGSGGGGGCSSLPGWSALKSALTSVVNNGANGGLGNNMWAVIVDTSGIVCAVTYSGSSYTSQWLGSRAIAAQKASTGNEFSLDHNAMPGVAVFPHGLALSTANLYSAVQPGGSLYGLQHSNPVDTGVAYGNSAGGQGNPPAGASTFGTPSDPMVGERVGGVNVFGGGLGLYRNGVRVGGIGVSGDTSCTNHMIAWKTRHLLNVDQLQGTSGVSGNSSRPDNIVFDITPNPNGGTGISTGGFGHPKCLNNPDQTSLPVVQ